MTASRQAEVYPSTITASIRQQHDLSKGEIYFSHDEVVLSNDERAVCSVHPGGKWIACLFPKWSGGMSSGVYEMRSRPAPSSQNPKQTCSRVHVRPLKAGGQKLGIWEKLGPRCSFSGSHVGAKIVEYISQRELSTHM